MISILLLGLLLGMKHAIEADHVAALATLATRSQSLAQTVKLGAVWGLGHTLTLLLFGGLVLALDLVMPERLAQALEFAVGIMLVLLGLDVLRRISRERVHFHIHRHAERSSTCTRILMPVTRRHTIRNIMNTDIPERCACAPCSSG